MRELKFRAWDKLDKEFTQNIDCLLDMRTSERVFVLDDENGELILEQYTGLKDKNGKEIYEGDIVRDGKGEKCLIKWTESEAHFGLHTGKQMELTDFIWMRGEDLEVVGNIHENAELLEEEE